jgi:hypothetical protein
VLGGDGSDTIDLSDRSSADDVHGGAGIDTVTYAERTSASLGVAATLDDLANDGLHLTSGFVEGDNIHSDVENVTGTSGPDSLTGSPSANRLDGGSGDDTIDGRTGDDTLLGEAGNDVIGQNPFLFCHFSLFFRRTVCIPVFAANPTPDGLDTIDGGPGSDLLSIQDGQADAAMQCGTGTADRAIIDLLDPPVTAGQNGCESVSTAARDQQPLVIVTRTAHADRAGRLSVRLTCPTHRRSCRGKLSLLRSRHAIANTGYRIRSGSDALVHVQLSDRARRFRRITLTVRAAEVDPLGRPVTSTALLRLR